MILSLQKTCFELFYSYRFLLRSLYDFFWMDFQWKDRNLSGFINIFIWMKVLCWVIGDRIFIFGQTMTLRSALWEYIHFLCPDMYIFYVKGQKLLFNYSYQCCFYIQILTFIPYVRWILEAHTRANQSMETFKELEWVLNIQFRRLTWSF